MARSNTSTHTLVDIKIYGPPNPVLAEILLSERMNTIVAEYTAKVATAYTQRLGKRSSGPLLNTIRAETFVGGYKHDRRVGQVSVGSPSLPYSAADEFGRNKYAQYDGSHDLRDSLYSVLPYKL